MKRNKKAVKPLTIVSPIHKAGRQMSLCLSKRTAKLAVQPGEAHLLSYLGLYGPCPVSDLVRVFGYKNATMTSILDRLGKGGYINRRLNPNDRRSFLVSTTAKGKRIAVKGKSIVEDFDQQVAARVTRDDLRSFQRVMEAVGQVTGEELRRPEKK